MEAWQATVQDEAGNIVFNPQITVYESDGVTLASIYNEDGSPKDNPFTGTIEGFAQFWADPGVYKVRGANGGKTELWEVDLGSAKLPPYVAFDSRAQAEAASIPSSVQYINVAGLQYVRDPSGTALETAGGDRWSPSGLATPLHFGATVTPGDDDTNSWNAFQAHNGPKWINPGGYRVDGAALSFDFGAFGDGNVKSNLTEAQRSAVNVGIDRFIPRNAKAVFTSEYSSSVIRPTLYVSSNIVDDSGAAANANVAGIYSYIEQTGTNTNQYPKSIAGTAVNAAGGDNDATGIVGYAVKLNVPASGGNPAGVGDAAGCGGVAWQRSQQGGLVIGGEFACHMAATPTYLDGLSGSGNRTMCVHVTTNSSGGPVWAGLSFDSNGLNPGSFGYYSAINFSRSSFAMGGEGVFPGTVGINFGSNTVTGPEKAVYLGNADYHFWRPANLAIRAHASTFDFTSSGTQTPGFRLVSDAGNYQGGFFGSYAGTIGRDGTSSLVTQGALVFGSNNYVSLRANNTDGDLVSYVEVSPVTNAFLPGGTSGLMSLGAPGRLWSQVYAATGTINTSDERHKQDISDIPDEVLDAWGEVGWCQFRFRDAVDQKGGDARLHSGVIAQRVIDVFARHGLDAGDYGLLCFDEWDEIPENITEDRVLTKHAEFERVLVKPAVFDEDGNEVSPAVYEDGDLISPEEYVTVRTVTPATPAGNRYGIRYEEALCIEAAYQRRRADRIEQRLAEIERLLSE